MPGQRFAGRGRPELPGISPAMKGMIMTSIFLAISLSIAVPTTGAAAADTVKAPKPPTLAPRGGREKPAAPTIGRGKSAPPSKGKPVGEPQLKRRKPPRLDFGQIR